MFESLIASCHETDQRNTLDLNFLESHAKQIVEIAFRAKRYLHSPDPDTVKQTSEAATVLLDAMERTINSPLFIAVCTNVQQKLDRNKVDKKIKLKTEFVMNPKAYAMKKVRKYKEIVYILFLNIVSNRSLNLDMMYIIQLLVIY